MQGRIQDFHLEGAQKITCMCALHECAKSISAGVHVLRGLEALGVFHALLCYLSLIFMHSDTKWDKNSKKHSQSNFS